MTAVVTCTFAHPIAIKSAASRHVCIPPIPESGTFLSFPHEAISYINLSAIGFTAFPEYPETEDLPFTEGCDDISERSKPVSDFIVFIAVIASFVQLVEMVVEKFAPGLYNQLGIFLPLIAVNCAIMGGSLFMQEREFVNIGQATSYGLGSGIGWWLAIIMMAAIREKVTYSQIPAPLKGAGITFIITGLMGIAFMTFLGIQL